jgi:hypothetical protein
MQEATRIEYMPLADLLGRFWQGNVKEYDVDG